jgi:phosphopantothenoylcysteine decarboxylase
MEQKMWKKRGDPILHIELRNWAQCLVIAPLSANTLAKVSNGLCDNLLTLVCRAWPMEKWEKGVSNEDRLKKPIIVCPSMNVQMWNHPVTEIQLNILKGWGFEILGPICKKMMCGEVGNGAMAEVKDIASLMISKYKADVKKPKRTDVSSE